MGNLSGATRYLAAEPAAWLRRPEVRLQPVLAKHGEPNIDLPRLAEAIGGIGKLADMIAIESPEHWAKVIAGLGDDVDAILPVSIPAYPTEIWNSHPQPLVKRGLPFVFWPLMAYDEPDFWRWSATDFLRALGVEVHLVRDGRHGAALLRALGLRRMLRDSRLVVFGEQNFPWNAPAAGHLVTESLHTHIVVRPMSDIRDRYPKLSDADVDAVWEQRRGRYMEKAVRPEELRQAVRTYLAIKEILAAERALGFGVNCFGDLVIRGGRDVPCLAQTLLREDGYIASCDGDYLAMMSMVLASFFLDKPCMMSNMYPVQYVGALRDHFGDPLSPDEARYPRETWANLARLGHCGWVGVVSPEMDPRGRVVLNDWGGTYEIKRDGRGCGIDGELAPGETVTAIELKFDGRTLLVAAGEACETTRHPDMPHCESTALLRFRDLPGFVENISREHTVVVYGDHVEDFRVLAGVLGLDCRVF
jgi:L-fucose isomerase-like protein